MPPKAANKAPKKSKKQPTTLPIKTTIAIVRRRNKLLDLKSKVGDKTDDISQERNQDIILKRLEKADLYSSSCLSFRKYNLMNIDFMEHSLTRTHSHSLRALDLAKNNLYSCSTIFKVCYVIVCTIKL